MKDKKDLTEAEIFIVNKVESLYEEWQIFTQYINEEEKDLQKNKENIIKELQDIEDDIEKAEETLVEKIEFLIHGFQVKIRDQKIMLDTLLTLYTVSLELGLDEYLTTDLNKVLSDLKIKKEKTSFIVVNGKVVEREKGSQKEAVKKILKSDFYKEYKEKLLKTV